MMYSSAAKCDNCERIMLSTIAHKTVLKQALRKEGRSFGKQDLCPDCKSKFKGDV